MTRRFSRYKWALQKLNGQIPAAGPIFEYNQWRTGAKIVTYTRYPTSKPGGFTPVGIDAFAFNDAAVQKVLVEVSNRADAAKTTVLTAAGVTALGWAPDLTGYAERFGFTPAKAIVFATDPTQQDTLVASQITGVRYNPREGASYTYPFGKTGTDGEADRGAAIQAVIPAANNVSFTPERARV